MDLQKRRSFIISFTYFTIIILICYLLLTRLIPMLMPFLAALVIAAFLDPAVTFMERHMKGGRTAAAPLVLLLFYGSLCSFLFLSGSRLVSLLQQQVKKLPAVYTQVMEPGLTRFFLLAEQTFPGDNLIISSFGERLIDFMENQAAELSEGLLNWGASALTGFPSFLFSLLTAIMASFFLTGNYRQVTSFFLRQLPEETRRLLKTICLTAGEVSLRLIKACVLLMALTFTELYAGFWVLGIPMKGTCAALVTAVDILPVLGTGTVLLPWAIISWTLGNPSLAFGLCCLYLLITVVRQMLEPRIIGLQMGLPPAAALLCMFAGARLLGLAGIFLFPIAAAAAVELNDRGILPFIK